MRPAASARPTAASSPAAAATQSCSSTAAARQLACATNPRHRRGERLRPRLWALARVGRLDGESAPHAAGSAIDLLRPRQSALQVVRVEGRRLHHRQAILLHGLHGHQRRARVDGRELLRRHGPGQCAGAGGARRRAAGAVPTRARAARARSGLFGRRSTHLKARVGRKTHPCAARGSHPAVKLASVVQPGSDLRV